MCAQARTRSAACAVIVGGALAGMVPSPWDGHSCPCAFAAELAALYAAAEPDASQGLFARRLQVSYARCGGPPYVVGDKAAVDLGELPAPDLSRFGLVFLDGTAAASFTPDHARVIERYLSDGGNVIVAAALSFADAMGPLLPLLPSGTPAQLGGCSAKAAQEDHPALGGIPLSRWQVTLDLPGGVAASGDARVLVVSDPEAVPLVAVREHGRGKIVATLLDHNSPAFSPLATPGYDALLTALGLALVHAPDDLVVSEAWSGAYNFWATGCFPIGYSKYRFGAKGPAVELYDEAEELLEGARRSLDVGDAVEGRRRVTAGLTKALAAAAAWQQSPVNPSPTEAAAASARREVLLLPCALDYVHSMNVSAGRTGAGGFWHCVSGSELLAYDPALDLPPCESAAFWRGLHPYVQGASALPTEADGERLWQRRADGTLVEGPGREIWLHPAVKAIAAQVPQYAAPGQIINKLGGASWAAVAGEPTTDFSAFAVQAFRIYLADHDLTPAELGAASWDEVNPPAAWSPTPLWVHWQRFRAQYVAERQKIEYWAAKRIAPSCIVALQPARIGDPFALGLTPEAAQYLDALFPDVMSGAGPGTDALGVELAVKRLLSYVDADADVTPDHWPGVLAKFNWANPCQMPPAAHRLASFVALLSGARGIVQSWASDPEGGEAAATMPAELFRRWQASFEPGVRHSGIFAQAHPRRGDIAVWESWESVAMSEGQSLQDSPDAWAGSQPDAWREVLSRAGYAVDLIHDRDIVSARLAAYQAVVVPSVLCVPAQRAAALETFAQQGGVLLVAPGSGMFDECHRPSDSRLARLCGVKVGPLRTVEEGLRVVGRGQQMTWGPRWQRVTLGGGARTVARDAAGMPAVSIRTVGRGAAICSAATPRPGDGPTHMFLQGLLESEGVLRGAYAVHPGGFAWQVRVLAVECGESVCVGVVNALPFDQQQPLASLRVRVRMPTGRYRARVLSDGQPYVRDDKRAEDLPIESRGGYVSTALSLEPFAVRLIELTPR